MKVIPVEVCRKDMIRSMGTGKQAAWQAERHGMPTLPDELLAHAVKGVCFDDQVACHKFSRRFDGNLGRPTSEVIWGRLHH